MADTSTVAGQVHVWLGGSLWIGRSSGTTTTHIHHAIQITLALEGKVQLKTPSDAEWTEYQGAIIPSHLHHALQSSETVSALIWVEPESPEGHALLDRFGSDGIQRIPDGLYREAAATMAAAYEEPQNGAGLRCQAAISSASAPGRLLLVWFLWSLSPSLMCFSASASRNTRSAISSKLSRLTLSSLSASISS